MSKTSPLTGRSWTPSVHVLAAEAVNAEVYDYSAWEGLWVRNQKHVNWVNYLKFWGMDEVSFDCSAYLHLRVIVELYYFVSQAAALKEVADVHVHDMLEVTPQMVLMSHHDVLDPHGSRVQRDLLTADPSPPR